MVYVLDKDGLVKEREIEIGIRDDQFVEVVSGLTLDDKIVIGDDVSTAEAEALKNDRRRGPF